MNKNWSLKTAILVLFLLASCTSPAPGPTPMPSNTPLPTDTTQPTNAPPPTSTSTPPATSTPVPATTTPPANAANPCTGAPAPAQWKHIVVLMFENRYYNEVIGPAPYITSLANQCATAPKWNDADYHVDGSRDGHYVSKPNYATLTNGLSPSVHGLTSDAYSTTTGVDNIYNQLNLAGLSFKDYYESGPGGCSVRFSGDYHDPIRYYTNVANVCDDHDVPLSTFMDDVNSGTLPAFSVLLPTNKHNMHSNSVASGDQYAQSILDPLLNSQAYANGDLAVFFLWDEDTPIPNIILAPSILPGTKMSVETGNPLSHFSALRTWEEMLGLPLLGDTGSAPSLLPYLDGRATTQ
jgi:phospholipase C